MPAPPALTELADTYPLPSNATFKAGITKFLNYAKGLLGATGDAAEARAALGLGTIGTRNILINGGPSINQRGVSGTVVLSAGQYGHDRWKAGAAGCTYTFAASGLDIVITITAGSLVQVVEGVNVAGGSYVLSWTGTAQGKIGAGSAAASPVTATGVTAGANLSVEMGVGTFTRAQLEVGASPSPFDRRIYSQEIALCQRYYETGTAYLFGYALAGGGVGNSIPFKVTKRSTPSLSYGAVTVVNATTFDARDPTPDCLRWYATATSTAGVRFDGTWAASAEL